jgi:hypothetical protein
MTRASFRGSEDQLNPEYISACSKLTDTPCDFVRFSVSNNRVWLGRCENTAVSVSLVSGQGKLLRRTKDRAWVHRWCYKRDESME